MLKLPVWMEKGRYSAEDDRRLIGAIVRTEGVVSQNDMKPSAGTNSMQVNISTGGAFINGDFTNSGGGGMYYVYNEGNASVTLPPAASAPRYDLIYLKIHDSSVFTDTVVGAVDEARFGVVSGATANSPAVPATPTNAIPICAVFVAPGVTAIQANNLTDQRPLAQFQSGLSGSTTTAQLSKLDSVASTTNPVLATSATSPGEVLISTGNGFLPVGGTIFCKDATEFPKSPRPGAIAYDNSTNREFQFRDGRWKFNNGDGPFISVGAGKSSTGMGSHGGPNKMVINPVLGAPYPGWEPDSSLGYDTYFGVGGDNNWPYLQFKRSGLYEVYHRQTIVNRDTKRIWHHTKYSAAGSLGMNMTSRGDMFYYIEPGDGIASNTTDTFRVVSSTIAGETDFRIWPYWSSNGRFEVFDYVIKARLIYEF